MRLKLPTRFTLMTLAKKSEAMGPSLPSTRPAPRMPAQFTASCRLPKASLARATAASTSFSALTSVLMKSAWEPSFLAASWPCCSLKSRMATLPPAFTTRSQVASPKPEAPPETMALILSKRMEEHPGDFVGRSFYGIGLRRRRPARLRDQPTCCRDVLRDFRRSISSFETTQKLKGPWVQYTTW